MSTFGIVHNADFYRRLDDYWCQVNESDVCRIESDEWNYLIGVKFHLLNYLIDVLFVLIGFRHWGYHRTTRYGWIDTLQLSRYVLLWVSVRSLGRTLCIGGSSALQYVGGKNYLTNILSLDKHYNNTFNFFLQGTNFELCALIKFSMTMNYANSFLITLAARDKDSTQKTFQVRVDEKRYGLLDVICSIARVKGNWELFFLFLYVCYNLSQV